MTNRNKSLDSLLEMSEDFRVPDQLFEDSDVNCEEVQIKVDDGKMGNDIQEIDLPMIPNHLVDGNSISTDGLVEVEAKKDDGKMGNVIEGVDLRTPQNKLEVKSKISPNSQDDSTQVKDFSQNMNTSSKLTNKSCDSVVVIDSAVNKETHTSTPSSVKMSIPSNTPSVQTPLKMVSIPVDSNIITQNNSQVVLIPVGGMDSETLQTSLKVPPGQKIVIIKPQEILKTIEQKKSQKSEKQNFIVDNHKVILQTIKPNVSASQKITRAQLPRVLSKTTVAPSMVSQSKRTGQISGQTVQVVPLQPRVPSCKKGSLARPSLKPTVQRFSLPQSSNTRAAIVVTRTSDKPVQTGLVVSQSGSAASRTGLFIPKVDLTTVNANVQPENNINLPIVLTKEKDRRTSNDRLNELSKFPAKPEQTSNTNVAFDNPTGAHIQKPAVNPATKVVNVSSTSKRQSDTAPLTVQSSYSETNAVPTLVSNVSSSFRKVENLLKPCLSNEVTWPSIKKPEKTSGKVVVQRHDKPRLLQNNNGNEPKSNLLQNETNTSQTSSTNELINASERGKSTARTGQVVKRVKNKQVSSTNPWTCALCGKPSFANSLGCLYGPYEINDPSGDHMGYQSGDHMGYQEENVREDSEPVSKKRRSSTSEKDSPCEVWFHGYCVVWSPGLYTVDNTLVGCEQVVIDARTRFCSICGQNGATLICLQRTCRKLFHFYCAKENGCVFDESNYTIQCGKHVK